MQKIINIIISALSFTTILGLFFHGVHLDQAAITYHYRVTAAAGLDPVEYGIAAPRPVAPDLHAHVDHNPVQSLLQFSDISAVNALTPRNEHRKHFLQRAVPRGRHAFDNILLPILS